MAAHTCQDIHNASITPQKEYVLLQALGQLSDFLRQDPGGVGSQVTFQKDSEARARASAGTDFDWSNQAVSDRVIDEILAEAKKFPRNDKKTICRGKN